MSNSTESRCRRSTYRQAYRDFAVEGQWTISVKLQAQRLAAGAAPIGMQFRATRSRFRGLLQHGLIPNSCTSHTVGAASASTRSSTVRGKCNRLLQHVRYCMPTVKRSRCSTGGTLNGLLSQKCGGSLQRVQFIQLRHIVGRLHAFGNSGRELEPKVKRCASACPLQTRSRHT